MGRFLKLYKNLCDCAHCTYIGIKINSDDPDCHSNEGYLLTLIGGRHLRRIAENKHTMKIVGD